jgi:bacterioferritin
MKGNPKVIDYLNNALRHELTAVNQYWLHYRLLDNWGYKVLAKQWRKESIEEMQHADKLIERIIFLDGNPNMQTLESLHIGQTVKEVLDRDLQAEMEARTLYEEAATHSHSVKDSHRV